MGRVYDGVLSIYIDNMDRVFLNKKYISFDIYIISPLGILPDKEMKICQFINQVGYQREKNSVSIQEKIVFNIDDQKLRTFQFLKLFFVFISPQIDDYEDISNPIGNKNNILNTPPEEIPQKARQELRDEDIGNE